MTDNSRDQPLSSDLLEGADEIRKFLYGDRKNRRSIYYLAEHSRLPVFRLGTKLCARRSVLMEYIAEQELHGKKP